MLNLVILPMLILPFRLKDIDPSTAGRPLQFLVRDIQNRPDFMSRAAANTIISLKISPNEPNLEDPSCDKN